jgi:hypothetical protein
MPTKTTDLFEVEHIEYVADRSVDEVASVLEEATGDVTDPKHASEVASAKDPDDFEARARWFEADSGFMRFLTLNDRGFLTLMDITGNSDRGKPGFPTGFANTREEHRIALLSRHRSCQQTVRSREGLGNSSDY